MKQYVITEDGRECIYCLEFKQWNKFSRNKTSKSGYQNGCSDCRTKIKREYISNLKDQILSHYGYSCVCCGEKEKIFLTVDHVNGGGRQHRKIIGTDTSNLYRLIIQENFPTEYQILCWNCNWGKHINGVCPHVSG